MTPLQLERLGEKIGRRWPEYQVACHRSGDSLMIEWEAKEKFTQWRILFFPASEDLSNALFIVWCLDRLQELHFRYPLGPTAQNHPVHGYAFFPENWEAMYFATTRAECCALALLAALESEHG